MSSLTVESKAYYKGKPLADCTREELLDIILELMKTLDEEYLRHIKTLKYLEDFIK